MALDQRRKRPLPARLVHAREQRLVAVAEILDILHVEVCASWHPALQWSWRGTRLRSIARYSRMPVTAATRWEDRWGAAQRAAHALTFDLDQGGGVHFA